MDLQNFLSCEIETVYPLSNDSPSPPLPQQPSLYLLLLWLCLPWVPHVSGTHTVVVFCDWLISLSRVSSWFNRVVAGIWISLLFKTGSYSIVGVNHVMLIRSSTYGCLGCFPVFLAFVNNAAVHTGVQISLWYPAFKTQRWDGWITG